MGLGKWFRFFSLGAAFVIPMIVPIFGVVILGPSWIPRWNMFAGVIQVCQVFRVEDRIDDQWSERSLHHVYLRNDGTYRQSLNVIRPPINQDVLRGFCRRGADGLKIEYKCSVRTEWKYELFEASCS